MKTFLTLLTFIMTQNAIIFDFSEADDYSSWRIVNDGVMGGLSAGKVFLNDDKNAVFFGEISLDNNGGFSSIRHRFKSRRVSNYTKIAIRLKGDGKKYQFRIKEDASDYYSYISNFKTSGDWEIIEIELKDMYPTFRGRKLRMKNFSGNFIEELAFLIGNKKEEKFRLEIDKIYLK